MKEFKTESGKTIYFGSNPTDEELKELDAFGIDVVWNLAQELSIEAELEREFAVVISSAIEDNKAPAFKSFFLLDLDLIVNYVVVDTIRCEP